MDEGEPRLRRRGMFFNIETPELDDIEHDSAEGISMRQAPTRKPTQAARATSLSQSVRAVPTPRRRVARRSIRSASGTGSRQQARMSR